MKSSFITNVGKIIINVDKKKGMHYGWLVPFLPIKNQYGVKFLPIFPGILFKIIYKIEILLNEILLYIFTNFKWITLL